MAKAIKINPYDVLGVSKDATEEEIKKNYKKLVIKCHPDRNPNNIDEANKKFVEVNKAYNTLIDADKRSKYDQFGIISGDEPDSDITGGTEGGFPFDLFGNLFGMNNGGVGMNTNHQSRNLKSPDKKITINLSLSDVYKGKNVPIDFTRNICCENCNGTGSDKPNGIKVCNTCNGKGRIVRIMQMGPMIQQIVQPCNNCNGVGKGIASGCECSKCFGKKTIGLKRHIDCYVRPGSASGTSITFKGESDWHPDFTEIGDLVVYVNVSTEKGLFRRESDNLIMKKSISLLEALTQTEFRFKHLDNRVLAVKYDKIINPGQQMIIKGEGMPNLTDNLCRGDLIICFDVIFPNYIESDRAKYLIKILPALTKQIWDLQMDAIPETDLSYVEMEPISENTTTHNSHNQNHNIQFNQHRQNNLYEEVDSDLDDKFDKQYRNATAGMPECATQ